MKIKPQRKSPQGVPAPERPCPGMFHALKKRGCVCRCPMFFKWPRLGSTGFLFLIVLSLKLFLFYLFIYFLQNTISVPTSSPTVQESLTLRWGRGRVGSGGTGPRKCRTWGEGSGLSTMRARLGGRAGRRRRTGQARTYTGAQGEPRTGPPKEAGGMAWGCRRSGFPKKEKTKTKMNK